MKCPNCSVENENTKRFCGDCGTNLLTGPDVAASLTKTIEIPTRNLETGVIFAGRYQVIEELGKGGMGRVYRVLDTALGIEIALKFINPEIASDKKSLERFKTEIKAARQIVHKNVAQMYDFNQENDVPFITMEYVKGEDLKKLIKKVGCLSPNQAVPITLQVCEGLAEAHRQNIIHNDLKPQNIMIDDEGNARIMDFGLARLQKSIGTVESGELRCTPAYVAPERVEALEVDNRSDLYSLGVVLYELVTGKMPFESESGLNLALKHVIEIPRDPRDFNREIPEALSRIIMRCLEKKREDRYQTPEELIAELRQVEIDHTPETRPDPLLKRTLKWLKAHWILLTKITASAAILAIGAYFILWKDEYFRKRFIAVLPVEDRSPQQDQESLCLGLQDNTIRILNAAPNLRVIPIYSVKNYDSSGKDSPTIARELKARYLLRMTLQTQGNEIEVIIDLIDGKRDINLDHYKLGPLNMSDLLDIDEDIAHKIATVLRLDLSNERLRTLRASEPKNLDAYLNYLNGMSLIDGDIPPDSLFEVCDEAIEKFREAIKLDGDYALAYWGLGNAYEARYYRANENARPEDIIEMRKHYHKAYDLNPDIAETNLGLGWIHFNDREKYTAYPFFQQARKLDPLKAVVNKDVGAFLRSIGMYRQAIKYFTRAMKLNPHDPIPRVQIIGCYMCLGMYHKARKNILRVLDKEPDNFDVRTLSVRQLIMVKKIEEAEMELDFAKNINPGHYKIETLRALLLAAKGDKENALAAVGEGKKLRLETTSIYLLLGMREEAVQNIQEGIEEGLIEGEYIYTYQCLDRNPIFRDIRNDPRFQEMLKKEKSDHVRMIKGHGKM